MATIDLRTNKKKSLNVGETITRKATKEEKAPQRERERASQNKERTERSSQNKDRRSQKERDTIDLRTNKKEEKDSSIKGQLSRVQEFGEKLVSGEFTDLGKKYEEKTGKKVLQLVYTGPSFGGTSLINNRIPDASVEAVGRAAGLTKKGIGQLKFKLGEARINQVLNTLTSTKSQGLIKTAMSKIFTKEAMILSGSLAGTVGLGKWAQKETPEPITFAMKDVYRQAQISGDWTLYEEAKAARDDLTDMNKWQQYLAWTPIISPFITIPRAIEGVIQGGKIMDEVANQEQIAQQTGETEEDKWARIDEERKANKEAERIEDEAYYAQIQKDVEKAKADARKEDEAYWNKVLREREAYETAKREAEAKYWEDVRKMNAELKKEEQKSYEAYGKSQLSFGLL